MRTAPAVRRAPVHQFADGAAVHKPRRNVEQALKHEVIQAIHEPLDRPVGDLTTGEVAGDFDAIPRPTETAAPAVTLRAVTTEDVDQLWDWSREDAEGVKAFLGHTLKNSRELFTAIGRLAQLEQSGAAWMQAITRDAHLIGFVLIAPIQRPENQPPVGTVHLYIAVPERGNLDAIVSSMLTDFDAKHSPMTLSVIVTRPEWSHVLQPLGFTSQTVLTRPATKPDGSAWV